MLSLKISQNWNRVYEYHQNFDCNTDVKFVATSTGVCWGCHMVYGVYQISTIIIQHRIIIKVKWSLFFEVYRRPNPYNYNFVSPIQIRLVYLEYDRAIYTHHRFVPFPRLDSPLLFCIFNFRFTHPRFAFGCIVMCGVGIKWVC